MNIILPKPYPAQLEVFKPCFDNETYFIIVNGSRQVGKTLLSTLTALKWALDTPNQSVMIVSPTDAQSKKIYKQMIQMIEPSSLGDPSALLRNPAVRQTPFA